MSDIRYNGWLHRSGTGGVYQDSSGQVGIGSSVPAGDINIRAQNPNIRFDDSDTVNNGEITLDNTQLRIEVDEDNAASNSALKFRIDGGDVALINSDGEMGVGTNNPDAMLHVSKSVSTAYDAGADSAQRSGTATINIENNDGTTNSFAQLVFDTAGSNQSIARIVALRTGSATNDLAFVTEHNNTKAERFRITSLGKVGIGSEIPAEKLDVNGTIQCLNELRSKTGNDLLLNAGSANRDVKIQVNDVNMLYVKGDTGYVGLGTDGPATKLHIMHNTLDCNLTVQAIAASKDARINLYAHSSGVSQIRFGDESDDNI